MIFGGLILAFVFFASVALGAATAWGLFTWTRRRWVWLLTPLFAFLWFLLGTGPFLLVTYQSVARPAPVIAPNSPMPPIDGEELVVEPLEEAP